MIIEAHEILRKWKVLYLIPTIYSWQQQEAKYTAPNIDKIKFLLKQNNYKFQWAQDITTEEELNKELERVKPFIELREKTLREEESKFLTKSYKMKILFYKILIICLAIFIFIELHNFAKTI